MEKKENVLPATTPEFMMLCKNCKHEFKILGTYEEADSAICPSCQSAEVENLYISFSTDGPGFQENYSSADFLAGGCSGQPTE